MHIEPGNIGGIRSGSESLHAGRSKPKDHESELDIFHDAVIISGPKDIKEEHITILHTNDLHGRAESFSDSKTKSDPKTGGMAYISAAVEKEKRKNPEGTILLDGGDISSGGPISDMFNAIPMVDAMNVMGYIAMSVGNHEFDFGREHVNRIKEHADFPVLSANIHDKSNDGKALHLQPYIIKDVKGIKLGILGLTTPQTSFMISPGENNILEFRDPISSTRENIPKMKKDGADLIVVLSHLGLDDDKKLANEVKGIDIIVGAHTHTELQAPEKVGNTTIVQTGAFGKNLGKMDLDIVKSSGSTRVREAKTNLMPINENNISPDPKVESIINSYAERMKPILNRRIGESNMELSQRDYHLFREESVLGNFVADSIRNKTGTDICFLNSGCLRANIPKGDIIVKQIYELFPWKEKVSILKMNGKNILEALEQSAKGPARGISVSGMKVEIDTQRPEGQRLVKVCTSDGQPIDPEKEYSVSTRQWVADGRGTLSAFTRAKERKDINVTLQKMLIDSIEEKGQIEAKKDGRLIYDTERIPNSSEGT